MKHRKFLFTLAVLSLLLSGCVKRSLVVTLDIPGNYSVKQKLAIAQGVSQDVFSSSFMNEVRGRFPSASEKYLNGMSINIKQFLLSSEKRRDVAIVIRMEYKSADLEAVKQVFDFIVNKVKSEIDYRIQHVGIELLLAQDNSAVGYVKKEYNNPSQTIYIQDKPVMTTSDIEKADFVKGDTYPGVGIVLNKKGISKIKEVSAHNIGKRMAVMINGQVICAPRIREPISDSPLQITGSFTEAQAKQLVDIINSGRITSGDSSQAAAP